MEPGCTSHPRSSTPVVQITPRVMACTEVCCRRGPDFRKSSMTSIIHQTSSDAATAFGCRGLGVVIVPRAGESAQAEAPEKSVYVADRILGEAGFKLQARIPLSIPLFAVLSAAYFRPWQGASFSSTMLRMAFQSRRASTVVKQTVSDKAARVFIPHWQNSPCKEHVRLPAFCSDPPRRPHGSCHGPVH